MDDSILTTIKKMLGIDADYTVFDTDIIVFINAAFMVLAQLGIGDREGFKISSADQTWASFISDFPDLYESVKTFIYLKVKVLFDPPANSYVMTSYNNTIDEYAWRLNIEAERRERDAKQRESETV